MSTGLHVVHDGTGASVGREYRDIVPMSCSFVPMGFALVGGLTGATASAFPSEVIDWTSADVVEYARPMSWHDDVGVIGIPALVESPARRQLNEIKRKSRLTWGQVADAIGVDARAIHLWRCGGGISAVHEERLHELNALIDSIDTGAPADVRAELLESTSQGSLLERLRAGESPRALVTAAPWRSRARMDLERNIVERENDGILDEDFVFLLYLDAEGVRTFAARAEELLGRPGVVRQDWEALLDAQFAGMRQPEPVAVEVAQDDEPGDDVHGIAPFFSPADLGIQLGVGAIASRRPLHEGL